MKSPYLVDFFGFFPSIQQANPRKCSNFASQESERFRKSPPFTSIGGDFWNFLSNRI